MIGTALAIVRDLARVPFVHVRLLVQTPAAWFPAVCFGVLVFLAWCHQLKDRPDSARERIIELLGFAFGAISLLWFFRDAQFSWDQTRDWQKEWTYYSALKQAAVSGRLPYYLRTEFQGTERYLANLETLVAPHAVLLRTMSVSSFFMLHMLMFFGLGYCGLIGLKRELELSPLFWVVFLMLFLFNGHISAHLGIGHTQWVSYFLLPWVFLCLIRAAQGDCGHKNATILALTLAAIIMIGGWHVFLWSLLFIICFCVSSRSRMALLMRTCLLVAVLAAFRLLPALLTFRGGSNVFEGSFETLPALLEALVGPGSSRRGLDPWEYDTYIGYVGFMILCLGAPPFRRQAQRLLNGFLMPSVTLLVLSMDGIYKSTLFRLPGFVSERVVTRFVIVPVLALSLMGCVRLDGWTSGRTRRMNLIGLASLPAAWFLLVQLVLRAEPWRPTMVVAGLYLPTDVLKDVPVEAPYWWSVWIGAAVSSAGLLALAIAAWSPIAVSKAMNSRMTTSQRPSG
jgi:hypothetical protein